MIRLTKSVPLRRKSCAMLCGFSSSCSSSLQHFLTFALVHALSLPIPKNTCKTLFVNAQSASQRCAAKARAPPSTASLVATCRQFFIALHFLHLPRPILVHSVFNVNRSNILRRNCSTPTAAQNFPRKASCSIIALHFTLFTFSFFFFSRLSL